MGRDGHGGQDVSAAAGPGRLRVRGIDGFGESITLEGQI
jgi:hypothetical protein